MLLECVTDVKIKYKHVKYIDILLFYLCYRPADSYPRGELGARPAHPEDRLRCHLQACLYINKISFHKD